MGCDIHLHIEVQKLDRTWLHYGAPRIERNYDLFEKMAGVRGLIQNAIVPPKGLPNDISEITEMDWQHWKDDGHSASWLSHDEIMLLEDWLDSLKQPGDFLTYDLEWAIFGMYFFGSGFTAHWRYNDVQYIPTELKDVRFVFWFDN